MQVYHLILVFHIFNILNCVAAQWCLKYEYVTKTRIQWNNGERQITKQGWFGNTKYRYEPYVFSTIEYYTDYERVTVCCAGYRKISDTFCQAICKPSCPTNSQCIRPNMCECTNGYTGYSAGPLSITCLPKCLPECPKNSYCSSGNKCVCNSGYKKNSSGICVPLCRNKCPENSTCIEPNNCSCNDGYKYNNNSMACDPSCSVTCPEDAVCTGPDTCVCPDDYELGKTEENTLVCVAKCRDDCPDNSFCSKPNFCECDSGFKKTFFGSCEPVCESPCPEHSLCSGPNNCTCGEGYEMKESLCQPICNNSCPEHAQCTEPNQCQCTAGYQLKISSSYNMYCEPQCHQNCSTFGKCIQPNKCECLEGYEMDDMELCTPICSNGCTNGLCYSPEICICNPGYLMGPNKQCEPVCSMACQNATCIEPEICQCSTGYSMKKGSVSICEPQCSPECINGACVDANVCICHDNYEHVITKDGGFNHSNCQRIETTTQSDTTTTDQTYITLKYSTLSIFRESSKDSAEPTAYTEVLIPDNIAITSTTTMDSVSTTTTPLVNSEICTDRCQCWEEYDELGPLSTGPHCAHSCLDAYDKPCLNFSLCQCDNAKTQLHCQSGEEDEEGVSAESDPILFGCRVLKQKEMIKNITSSRNIDIKNAGYNKGKRDGGGDYWNLLCSIIAVCTISSLAAMLYIKCRRHQDPIAEYEL